MFRPGGRLYVELEKAHFGNDDIEESCSFQETIQLACSDMTIPEIEAKYGPIQLLADLQSAVADTDTFSQRLTNISQASISDSQSKQEISATTDKYKGGVKIKSVFLSDEQALKDLEQT